MKLIYRILTRLSVGLLVLMAGWSFIFYYVVVGEISDETDDALEYYSEHIIRRALAGEELPTSDNGTNNSYYITEITPEYAAQHKGIRYFDELIFVESKQETEPARVMKTIYRSAGGQLYELTVLMPGIEKRDIKEAILSWIVYLYVLLILVVIAVNTWIVRRSFRPLYKLLDWLDHFKVDKMPEPIDVDNTIPEFKKLIDAAYRNAERNSELYEQQKQFIGHASHELQTPLAVCKNHLEMLAEQSGFTEEQLGEIMKVRATLDRIIRLNKTLLLLTKIDNHQFPGVQQIEINSLVRKILEDYEEVYAHKQFQVVVSETMLLQYEMNDSLAAVLFANLLKNAFLHTRSQGVIKVQVYKNKVAILNTAQGKPLDENSIYQRFFHTTTSENTTGLGLGLTLVSSVCKMYHIHLSYSYQDDMHCFTLTFPLA